MDPTALQAGRDLTGCLRALGDDDVGSDIDRVPDMIDVLALADQQCIGFSDSSTRVEDRRTRA